MTMARDEALQPRTELSGLSDSHGTWRKITLSNSLPARQLDCNNVKNDNDNKDYNPNNLYVHSISNHFYGRRNKEQLSDEEAPTRKRQYLEKEHDDIEMIELTNQERSSYTSETLSPTKEYVFIVDDSSSSDDFLRRWKTRRREQMSGEEADDEEAPTSKRQCLYKEHDGTEVFEVTDQEISLSPMQPSGLTLDVTPVKMDSSSSDHFWWGCKSRKREQMSGEEEYDKETPCRKRQHMEQRDEDNEFFELTDQEISSSSLQTSSLNLEVAPIKIDSSSSDHFFWRWKARKSKQMSGEEGDDEGASCRKRQHMEQRDEDNEFFELTDQEISLSSLQTSSLNLEVAPIKIDSSSSDHFFWRWKARKSKQMSGEEGDDEGASCRKRQHMEQHDKDSEVSDITDEEISLSSLQTSSCTLEDAPIKNDSSSIDDFWWRQKMMWWKMMCDEEYDYVKAFPSRSQYTEPEEDECKSFEPISEESSLSSKTLEYMPIVYNSTNSNQDDDDDDEEAPLRGGQPIEKVEDEFELPSNSYSHQTFSPTLELLFPALNAASSSEDVWWIQ